MVIYYSYLSFSLFHFLLGTILLLLYENWISKEKTDFCPVFHFCIKKCIHHLCTSEESRREKKKQQRMVAAAAAAAAANANANANANGSSGGEKNTEIEIAAVVEERGDDDDQNEMKQETKEEHRETKNEGEKNDDVDETTTSPIVTAMGVVVPANTTPILTESEIEAIYREGAEKPFVRN
jgi:hypothetical protein